MDASSISEEDIIEICVKWGCTHPLGVLHYSAEESIVLFLTMDDLKCASHDIAGETKLHDEAIMVKALAPTEAHMSAYTMVSHVKPSKGAGRPHTLPQQTPIGGETLHCLHAELGDLDNHKLRQLMADLNQELAQHELIVPPVTLSKQLGTPIGQPRAQGGRPGGHLPRRGKMGSAEAAHSRATGWRRGSLWTAPETILSCTSRTRHGAINYHPNIRFAHRHP